MCCRWQFYPLHYSTSSHSTRLDILSPLQSPSFPTLLYFFACINICMYYLMTQTFVWHWSPPKRKAGDPCHLSLVYHIHHADFTFSWGENSAWHTKVSLWNEGKNVLGFPFVYLNVLKELGRGREPAEAQPGPSSLLGAASRGFGSARCPVRPPIPVSPAVQAGCRVGRGCGPMELAAIKKKKKKKELGWNKSCGRTSS